MSDDEGGRLVPFPGAGPAEEGDTTLLPALEALLFAAGTPVSARALAEALEDVSPSEVRAGLERLQRRLATSGRALELVQVAGGWQLRTDPRWSGPVLRLLGGTPQRLSPAALETLSVVAYRQPVTRAEVEALRGVGCGPVLRTLMERGLVRVAGRRHEPGRPLEYATTDRFLEVFGLLDLDALPTLREREELDDT